MSIQLAHPRSEHDWLLARRLIEEYAASLDLDLSFQNLAHELDSLRAEYGPPAGAFLLASEQDQPLGCVGLRRFADDVGEIKRLYVSPLARGRRLGRTLAQAIIAEAQQLSYARLVLDTLPTMREAQSLYTSLGFAPTAPYRFNPVPGTVFLELKLR